MYVQKYEDVYFKIHLVLQLMGFLCAKSVHSVSLLFQLVDRLYFQKILGGLPVSRQRIEKTALSGGVRAIFSKLIIGVWVTDLAITHTIIDTGTSFTTQTVCKRLLHISRPQNLQLFTKWGHQRSKGHQNPVKSRFLTSFQ